MAGQEQERVNVWDGVSPPTRPPVFSLMGEKAGGGLRTARERELELGGINMVLMVYCGGSGSIVP